MGCFSLLITVRKYRIAAIAITATAASGSSRSSIVAFLLVRMAKLIGCGV